MSDKGVALPPLARHEDGSVSQTMTITATMWPDKLDDDGNPLPPQIVCTPSEVIGEGDPHITPEDCISLCTEGIRWALLARLKVNAKAAEVIRRQSESRVIRVGDTKGRIPA